MFQATEKAEKIKANAIPKLLLVVRKECWCVFWLRMLMAPLLEIFSFRMFLCLHPSDTQRFSILIEFYLVHVTNGRLWLYWLKDKDTMTLGPNNKLILSIMASGGHLGNAMRAKCHKSQWFQSLRKIFIDFKSIFAAVDFTVYLLLSSPFLHASAAHCAVRLLTQLYDFENILRFANSFN